ncbi:MAG: SDR family oxidoreductase [Bacteroidales bacterium]|nr:SDR family oxidoreductase [Bacteroidales bacterium]
MGLLDGKIVIVTGGSKGIGEAIVRRFLREGASVVFTCRHMPEGLVEELGSLGTVRGYESDASCFDAAHDVVSKTVSEFGRIDVLVNNAGIVDDGLLLRMSEDSWDSVINNNLKSAFNFSHAVAPFMMRQRSGSMIFMSSCAGVHGNAGQVNYGASKAGMLGLAKSICKELGPRGVRANCISPGMIESEMVDRLNDRVKEFWLNNIPMHRWGTKEEVAGVALFLASDLSSYVNGEVISCCGGVSS